MNPNLLSAGSLTGDDIVNPAEDKLGTLKELMIDVGSGEVAYAVLARGGVAGVGQKLFAVPWSLLTVDGDNKRLVLDMDAERLDNSPGFDPDDWPSFSDLEWQQGVHEYYGVDPYWERNPPVS